MTAEQLAILGADIAKDPAFADVPHTSDGAVLIADEYNVSAGAEAVWRTSVPREDILGALDWVAYLGLDDPHRDALALLLTSPQIDLSEPSLRKAFGDVLGATVLDPIAKREMTRAERLFAAGPDGDGIFTLTFEGPVAYPDVQAAREVTK